MATEESNARALLKYLALSPGFVAHVWARLNCSAALSLTGRQACFRGDLSFTVGFNQKQTHRILKFSAKAARQLLNH